VVDAQGTGLYTISKGSVSLIGEKLLETGKGIVLAIDKPGIEFDSTFKSNSTFKQFSVNIGKFSNYTVQDLISCYLNAIEFHLSKLSNKISFLGHSEGAVVLFKAYRQIAEKMPQIYTRINRLILTGTPFDPLDTIIFGQLERKYQKGIRELLVSTTKSSIKMDKNEFLIPYYSVSSRWIKSSRNLSSLESDFNSIHKKSPRAEFLFFHGEKDENTPIDKIKKFVNSSKLSSKVKVSLKSYEAGHYLNMEAMKDIGKIFNLKL